MNAIDIRLVNRVHPEWVLRGNLAHLVEPQGVEPPSGLYKIISSMRRTARGEQQQRISSSRFTSDGQNCRATLQHPLVGPVEQGQRIELHVPTQSGRRSTKGTVSYGESGKACRPI